MGEVEKLAESYQRTYLLIGKFAVGLTHEDSITQPPFNANTFNWVLGHILVSRDRAIRLLDRATVLGAKDASVYETGSKPVNAETAVSLPTLLHFLDISQKLLIEGLEASNPAALEQINDDQRKQSVGERLSGLHWHETYHVGQLEILRQVSGFREDFP